MSVLFLHLPVFLFGMASLFGEILKVNNFNLVFFRCVFAFIGLVLFQGLLKKEIKIDFSKFIYQGFFYQFIG